MSEMIIMSIKWTKRRDPYISFWGPDNGGYLWPIESVGRYTEEQVRACLFYYHNGHSTLAVPAAEVMKYAVAADPEWMSRRTDLTAVPNTKDRLALLKRAALAWSAPYSASAAQADGGAA